jgi:hypothetical protein
MPLSTRPNQFGLDDSTRYRQPPASHKAGPTVPPDAKEVLVQKLQGALHAIRRDRDHEHRQRDMAVERLRSAKAAVESVVGSVGEEKTKLVKTRSDLQSCQQEVRELERETEVLKQKVRYVSTKELYARHRQRNTLRAS